MITVLILLVWFGVAAWSDESIRQSSAPPEPPRTPANSAETATAIASWISAVAAVGALIVVVVGAKIAIEQTREAARTRTSALMADLSRRWDEPLLMQSRRLSSSFPRNDCDAASSSWSGGTTRSATS